MFQDAEDLLPTRLSLLGRLKNWEDEESWREFFNTYWKLIYGVAMRAGLNDAEAQDVVQETIITVAKQMPSFNYDPGIGSFKGWLLNITRWRINDQLRKRKRDAAPRKPSHDATTVDTELIESVPDPVGNELDRVWDQEWEKNIIDIALENIKPHVSPKHFQIFDLYVIKKWPVRKVARALGVNIGQVYLAKHRVSNLIKKEISKLETNLK